MQFGGGGGAYAPPQNEINEINAIRSRNCIYFIFSFWRLLINEINTIPGFTKNSMFPMLWEASGLKIEQLVAKLVDISLDL